MRRQEKSIEEEAFEIAKKMVTNKMHQAYVNSGGSCSKDEMIQMEADAIVIEQKLRTET